MPVRGISQHTVGRPKWFLRWNTSTFISRHEYPCSESRNRTGLAECATSGNRGSIELNLNYLLLGSMKSHLIKSPLTAWNWPSNKRGLSEWMPVRLTLRRTLTDLSLWLASLNCDRQITINTSMDATRSCQTAGNCKSQGQIETSLSCWPPAIS